jgi:thiol-disulfide isomerase/thioredoxin
MTAHIMEMANRVFCWLMVFAALPASGIGQVRDFQIDGTITGQYKSRIFLFYEDEFAEKDSLTALISHGRFHFSLRADQPILCRLHFGENTNIQEFYAAGPKVRLVLTGHLSTEKPPGSDSTITRSHFSIVGIQGSPIDGIRRSFLEWKGSLDSSSLSSADKAQRCYERLHSLIEQHPGSKISAYLLGKASNLSYSQVDSLRRILNPSLNGSFECRMVSRSLAGIKASQHRNTGVPFHNAEIVDQAGNHVTTGEFKSAYILYDFWASWCHPCRAQNPGWKKLYARFHDKGFEIVGISLDQERQQWLKAIKMDGLTWPQLDDPLGVNGDIAKYYDIFYVPASILVDENGTVQGFNMSQQQISELLETRLK